MASNGEDEFVLAADRLERIWQLREKEVIGAAEFDELKKALMQGMRDSAGDAPAPVLPPPAGQRRPIPYGKLHDEVLRQVAARHGTAELDPKVRLHAAMGAMMSSGALNQADAALLPKLIDAACQPMAQGGADDGSPMGAALGAVTSVSDAAQEIRASPQASDVARALADTVQTSSIAAADKYREQTIRNKSTLPAPLPQPVLRDVWKKFALKDVEGAFEGGAAAAGVAPAFGMAVPVAAALGIVIVGGVRSALAYAGE